MRSFRCLFTLIILDKAGDLVADKKNREKGDGLMQRLNARGFSLIEVLVAAGVVSLSLVSTVAFIRKGQELLMVDKHRRMARAIIGRTLESQPYRAEFYNNLVTTAPSPSATGVVIDAETSPALNGFLTVTVSDEQAGVNGHAAAHRIVTARVTWTEPGGNKDTVSIEHWLTNIQRE
jgi:prepilin-type N-terminal cleavage/methylation domain-containing protein